MRVSVQRASRAVLLRAAGWVLLAGLVLASPAAVAQDENYVLSVDSATGVEGDTADVDISLSDPDGGDVEGFSWGLCHDSTYVSIADGDVVNGSGLDDLSFTFHAINIIDEDGWTVGALLGLSGDVIEPAEDIQIQVATYSLDAEGTSDLAFCEIGDPEVVTLFIVDDEEITPTTESGELVVEAPPEFDVFDLDCTGGLTSVTIEWSIGEVFAYQIVNRNGSFLELIDGDATSYEDLDLEPGTYDYVITGTAFPESGTVVDVEKCSAEVIPIVVSGFEPALGHYAGGTEITISGAGFELGSDLTVEIGGVTADSITIVDDGTITCEAPSSASLGSVDVFVSHSEGDATAGDTFLYGFIRGDFNGDATLTISDPLVGLDYMYTDGDTPECLDAVDANDDADLDLTDAILVLQYLFNENDPPQSPFPDAGLDPEEGDSLGCLEGEE